MKKLVVALGAGTLAIGAIMVQLWSELQSVRAQTVLLNERIANRQLAQATVVLKPGVTRSDNPATTAGELSPRVSAAASVPDRETYVRKLRATMARAEELSNASLREMMPDRYPDLAKELALTASQLDKLFDLLASQQTSLMGDVRARGSAPLDAAARKQTNEAEVATLLGGKYSKWQEYQRTLPVRKQVAELQSVLGPDALSETQSGSLIAALAAEKSRNQETRRNGPRLQNMEALRHAAEEDNARLLAAAAAHLNPQQLDAYRKFLQREQSTSTALMEIMRSSAGAGPNR